MATKPLLGRTVAVPETRELDKLVRMLADEGAVVLSYPLVGIRDVEDSAPVEAWLRMLADGSMSDVVLMTGEGVHRLLGFAARAEILEPVLRALGRVRTITRGPKPAAALHAHGIRPTLPARIPTADGIIRELSDEDLHGRHVGVQLYAENASGELLAFLERKGATVSAIAPYTYTEASDDERVIELIQRLVSGKVDAIAFTSSAQVDRVFQVASEQGATETLHQALLGVTVAAVGPTCASTLRSRGVAHAIMPERSFFMRSLVAEMCRTLTPK